MYRIGKNDKGFTVVELMIVLFITSVIFVFGFNLLRFNFEVTHNEWEKNLLESDFRMNMNYLVQDIMEGKGYSVLNEPDKNVIEVVSKSNSKTSYIFENNRMYIQINDGEVKDVIDAEPYLPSEPQVYVKDGLIHFNFLSKSINSLTFFAIEFRNE